MHDECHADREGAHGIKSAATVCRQLSVRMRRVPPAGGVGAGTDTTFPDRAGRWANESRGYLLSVYGVLPPDFPTEEEENDWLAHGEFERVLDPHLKLLQQAVAP